MTSMREGRFGASIEDAIIVPLVLVALGVRKVLRFALSTLIHIVDYAFPIFLRLMRFPLFTVRIIGDGFIGALKLIVTCLPVSRANRARWREAVSRHWAWIRQKLSYKAFEEAVHHAFENGMAWVFRKCRSLTPRAALLTIIGAVIWLPVSFGAATGLHAVLIAKAASLPAWMQLLHPLATIIAKSKLLILPVYPAAWPQAKKHIFVQKILQFYRALMNLHVTQKTVYRYRQAEEALTATVTSLARFASRIGIGGVFNSLLADLNDAMAWIRKISRVALRRTARTLSTTPLVGPLFRNYAARYEDAEGPDEEKFSEKVRGFFGRWSIKFSAEYYEAKEREEAALRDRQTQAGSDRS